MKSPMVQNATYLPEKTGYSDLQVMRSGGGWYVGTTYTDPKDGLVEPGSRDSDYFGTEAEAAKFLKMLEGVGDDAAAVLTRDHP